MILTIAESIDLGRYMAVLYLHARLKGKFSAVRRIQWDETDLSKLDPNETLYITAHGSTSSIEGKSAEMIAKLLAGKGLDKDAKLKKIKLMACSSGITTGIEPPFCAVLQSELVKNGCDTKVVGFDAKTHVIASNGKSYGKDVLQSSYPNRDEWLRLHESNYKKWNSSAQIMSCLNEEEFIKNARLLAEIPEVKAAFEWLFLNNDKYLMKDSMIGKTHATSDGIFKRTPLGDFLIL